MSESGLSLLRWLHHGEIPRAELLRLASFAAGLSRESLLARPDVAVSSEAIASLERMIARRIAGEPMAYLLGHREFYGRDFAVDSRVLIPRHETELLVDLAIAWIATRSSAGGHETMRVLDLGTGSGIVAITLALECPSIEVAATDISSAALEIAAQNAQRLGATLRLVQRDWFDGLEDPANEERRFDLIVSNPPYVATGDPHLAQGDLRYEPRGALTAGADGLEAIRRIVAGSAPHLRSSGCLMIEHGYDQAEKVRNLLRESGFVQVATTCDLAGVERVTGGMRAGSTKAGQ